MKREFMLSMTFEDILKTLNKGKFLEKICVICPRRR